MTQLGRHSYYLCVNGGGYDVFIKRIGYSVADYRKDCILKPNWEG